MYFKQKIMYSFQCKMKYFVNIIKCNHAVRQDKNLMIYIT